VKILTVCGGGVGTSLLMLMNVKTCLDKLGVEANVQSTDIGSARAEAMNADIIVISNHLADQLGVVAQKVITVKNIISEKEMSAKLTLALDEMSSDGKSPS